MNNRLLQVGWVVFLMGMGGLWWFVFSGEEVVPPLPKAVSDDSIQADVLTIIAFGDSLTAGYGVSQVDSYPYQLEVALRNQGYNVRVVNAGVSGETTRGNLERANFIRSQNPDMVILGIGGNDSLRSLPIEETEKNIRATIEILQSGMVPPRILLLHMRSPLNSGLAYKRRFDALYETIAREKNITLVPFLTADIFLVPDNKLDDGIHYNRIGYQQVVDRYLLPSIKNLLDAIK